MYMYICIMYVVYIYIYFWQRKENATYCPKIYVNQNQNANQPRLQEFLHFLELWNDTEGGGNFLIWLPCLDVLCWLRLNISVVSGKKIGASIRFSCFLNKYSFFREKEMILYTSYISEKGLLLSQKIFIFGEMFYYF